MRLGTIFVLICMAIIAASAGATAYLAFGFGASEATIIGLATLAGLSLYNFFSTRSGIQSAVTHQFADLTRGEADLARQVAELSRRLAAVENRLDITIDRTRTITDPIALEIGELGTLVKQLAETVTAQQAALAELVQPPPLTGLSPVEFAVGPNFAIAPSIAVEPDIAAPGVVATPVPAVETAPQPQPAMPPADAPPPAANTDDEAALAAIRSAIDGNRIDLYLQPIVTLPQRKVRYYEAMSRLRSDRGDPINAGDFVARAERGGLMPKIDNLVVFRCVQVVRRLLLKNREIGLFCNLSGATLGDATFPQFLEFVDANRAIAPSLMFEFTQTAVRAMGPIEHESLAALAERGFRFSLDNVVDLRFEPRELASRNFRFIKVPASFLLNRTIAQADIHPSDLSDLLGRFGIDLIAEKIETEGSVVDLLDCDVRYGQGFLFSPPRPVRAEALQGVADRSDVAARDPARPDESAAPPRMVLRPAPSSASETSQSVERTTGLAALARGVVSRG